MALESPAGGRRDVEPVLGTDDAAPPPDQPESPYLSLDELLFGAVSTQADAAPEAPREPVKEPPLLDEDRFVEEHEFGDDEELIDDDELAFDDDTIVAEPAEIDDATDPTGSERGRRRARVLAGLVTFIVVAGTAVGAVVVGGRSADSAPRKKSGSEHKATSGTTTSTVPTTAPASIASTPVPVTTAPLTAATTSRAVPLPTGAAIPPPPTTSPPPPTPPPTAPPAPTTSSPPPTTTSLP